MRPLIIDTATSKPPLTNLSTRMRIIWRWLTSQPFGVWISNQNLCSLSQDLSLSLQNLAFWSEQFIQDGHAIVVNASEETRTNERLVANWENVQRNWFTIQWNVLRHWDKNRILSDSFQSAESTFSLQLGRSAITSWCKSGSSLPSSPH